MAGPKKCRNITKLIIYKNKINKTQQLICKYRILLVYVHVAYTNKHYRDHYVHSKSKFFAFFEYWEHTKKGNKFRKGSKCLERR